ncbi:MAG: hypothetical protein C4297_13395 [Gemmataceae bacterium]
MMQASKPLRFIPGTPAFWVAWGALGFGTILAGYHPSREHGSSGLVTTRGNSLSAAESLQESFGTIRGQVVFAADKIPAREKLKIDRDQDHCLSKGPLLDEKWVVNPDTKGVQWVVVFLRFNPGAPITGVKAGEKLPDAVLDQPVCYFHPHVLAVREGQRIVAKNPAPVAHNVVITGLKNSYNIQIPPGGQYVFDKGLVRENNAIKISCGAHPWMSGWAWVFDHPYFAVTDEQGRFEMKAPAGEQRLVVWHEAIGYLGGREGRQGRPVQVPAGGVLDLGRLEIKPTQ